MIFLVADIAFVPLEVFFVTMVLDKILEKREKSQMMEKLSMLVGLFYSKLGQDLLDLFASGDKNIESLRPKCRVDLATYEMDFKLAREGMMTHKHRVSMEAIDLVDLKRLLDDQEPFLVNMISNPALLEHDTFSDLLMSLFHLREELDLRQVEAHQGQLADHVLDHLRIDINRAYRHLSIEWVDYMKHLKDHYPFLYVTAIMRNPYDMREADQIEAEIMNHYYQQKAGH